MDRLKQSAIIISLIKHLSKKGCWCGETHIQKTTYFLQELLKVPLGFDFILYKHGPYSFDLRDELMFMRANMLVELKSQQPYGSSIVPGPTSGQLKHLFPKTLEKYQDQINFIADNFAGFNVADLERIATAFFISEEICSNQPENIAARIHVIKPHISEDQALDAIKTEKKITREAKKLLKV
jgi:hypothetical protein